MADHVIDRMEKPELLAPAGGWSQLRAALRFGADAVYFACDKFGMRARSDNFKLEDLPALMQEVHGQGARAYTTVNTIMTPSDMRELPRYIDALAQVGVDGIIVGDAGTFSLIKKHAPQIPLHISTQMSISNAEAARFWYEAGAQRVVVAREMSLEDIADLRANTPPDLEIEAFVHGAMCVAYSGRCLLSAVTTGRSGNRGACAQSCRWSYALVEEKRPGEFFEIEEDTRGTYILNSEDMNMIAHLDELTKAGISSFKIEGRNKRAFYVATVVAAYRSVLDGGSVENAQKELLSISHRPYGTGFYFDDPDQTPNRDGYIRECVHVGTIEACEEQSDGSYRITARCHNRFAPFDDLGVLSPHRKVRMIQTGPLELYLPLDNGRPFVERGTLSLDEVKAQGRLIPVEVANRSKEHYVFYQDRPLEVGDYLRRKTYDAEREVALGE